ncbi:hypothetical protein E7T06_04910 [Deinococcus sp. Arct2-2]|uniref:hypothetical protein n=1 Tax=Deinococcus sp. Arct2-2 TaxID=2568653 RepID=UPI0010A553BF|nr:hypothetical protein [Deinococcus sp. Arct2-2]THF70902.1 hypothetical protein E7T06_04910 [Deinococcus sp. Arct2-2]
MSQEPELPPIPHPPSPGRVYVLRVWNEPGVLPGGSAWRASLREGTLGERQYFASIDDCIDHLYGEFTRRDRM